MTLLGREAELAAIDELLGHLDNRGGCLLVKGEPGIGKSALLDEAAARATGAGLRVLRTAGIPSEQPMAFAALDRLLRPYASKIADLPSPQRDALASAFGLSDGGAPDLFLIALAALNVLAEAAADSPVVVIVEDAQWLDADAGDVLAFVARRVELEPIAVMIAVREGRETRLEQADLPELKLAGLGGADSARLLDSSDGSIPTAVRRRLLDIAAGNPLALLELPRAVEPEDLARSWAFESPPLTAALERAFTERVSALPEPTRIALISAALDEEGTLEAILRAASVVAERELTQDDLAPAEAAGLLQSTGTGVSFRHPLVRAAIEQATPPAIKRATHAALAAAYVNDRDRQVWHRAGSLLGPDPEVVAELEAAALRAVRRGAPAVAATALERAAQLTAQPTVRGGLLLRAAEMESELGRSDLASGLLAQARPLELDEQQRAQLALLHEAADEDSWSGPERVASVAAIASRHAETVEPELALRALLPVARSCWWGNATQETRDLVVATAESLGLPDEHPALIAVVGCTDPAKRGAQVVDRISAMTPGGGPVADHLLGTAATAILAFDLSWGFLTAAVAGLRAQGRLGLLSQALVSQSWAALHLAKPTVAATTAQEAANLARETGQPRWATAAELVLATLAGERGEFERAERIARDAEAELLPVGAQAMLALVQFSRGRGMVAHQRYSDGYEQLRRILDPTDIAYHALVGAWGLADLIESAVNLDKRDEAQVYLALLEDLAAATQGSYLHASRAYVLPLLATDDEAEELFQAALATELANWPCYRLRMLLSYGRWLRRQRRVAESRAPLRAAREGGYALGFGGLAEAARQELRASGEASRTRSPDLRDELTPQEMQIAQLAAEGLSNREIGERLYLSHRTVGSHLYRTFPKLGITSRTQLAQVLGAGADRVSAHADGGVPGDGARGLVPAHERE